jgi:NADH-quinone oxidoreductase E subunit
MTLKEKLFSFNPENLKRAEKIIAKYPSGRQASAVIPLLDLAQRQNNNYLTTEVMDYVAEILSMPAIRVYEVAHFYTMFNHKPVGKFHMQLCGTTPCWLKGAADLAKVCKSKLGLKDGEATKDGMFSFKEVECLGACVNAPVMQINDDFVEDLTPEALSEIIDNLAAGKSIKVGPQCNRHSSEAACDKKLGETKC